MDKARQSMSKKRKLQEQAEAKVKEAADALKEALTAQQVCACLRACLRSRVGLGVHEDGRLLADGWSLDGQCVPACLRACLRACIARAAVSSCIHAFMHSFIHLKSPPAHVSNECMVFTGLQAE